MSINERVWHGEVTRDGWPEHGAWRDEPDRVAWTDAATGMVCAIVRPNLGHLCGYVAVTPHHPWYGLGYDQCWRRGAHDELRRGVVAARHGVPVGALRCDEAERGDYCDHPPERIVEVHGGLTFSDAGRGRLDLGNCAGGAPWWFGFDCSHSGDYTPGMAKFNLQLGFVDETGDYRDVAYVRRECARLAGQLAAITWHALVEPRSCEVAP